MNILVKHLLLLLLITFSKNVFAQDTLSTDYPFIYDIELSVFVELDDEKNLYSYTYNLYNNSANKGEISQIQINLNHKSVDLPDTAGLIFQNSFVKRSFERKYSIIKEKVVPVGFSHSPNNWYGAYSLSGYGVFSGNPFVGPGDSLKKNTLVSYGLPSIRKLTIKPRFDVRKFFQSLDDPNRTQTIMEMDSLRNMVNYYGFTIGPWLPDSSMSPQDFTDSLETFRLRSCEELGWITNQGICNSLRVKLRNVRRHLERDKPKQARNVLNAFINQVEAQRGKHITEEGYALLYFNAEYLMDKLDSGRGD